MTAGYVVILCCKSDIFYLDPKIFHTLFEEMLHSVEQIYPCNVFVF